MAKPWADKPFELLTIPGEPGGPSCGNSGLMSVCVEMANVHNALLRGLNSIYLQAPHVKEPADIADFMLYTKAWADTVHHHHSLEESLFFPRVQELAKEAGYGDHSMDPNVDQHHTFEPRIHDTVAWVEEVREGKREYDSKTLLDFIDSFASILTEHLHAEIHTLIKLDKCDSGKIQQAMADAARVGGKTADVYLVLPQVLGCVDKGYPGSANFPPLPFFVPYLNAYWFARTHSGCWRFNPCDHWGRPRPLQFL